MWYQAPHKLLSIQAHVKLLVHSAIIRKFTLLLGSNESALWRLQTQKWLYAIDKVGRGKNSYRDHIWKHYKPTNKRHHVTIMCSYPNDHWKAWIQFPVPFSECRDMFQILIQINVSHAAAKKEFSNFITICILNWHSTASNTAIYIHSSLKKFPESDKLF